MAGLLDFFGSGWEDPKSQAVMALAGGLLDGDFASGVKGYANTMAGAQDAKMKRLMQEAQIAKYGADTEMDKQKLSLSQGKEKRDSDFESMMMDAIKKRISGGGVAMPNMPVTGSGGNQGGQSGMPSGGQSFDDPFAGVNPMAMMLDMRNNSGKKIGDWVNDRTAPKWENINGNMVNTNAPNFQGGFQSGFKAADNGQVTMFHPDGQGGLVVGAPRGALDTYSAFRNIDEAAKAGFKLEKVTLPSGQEVMLTADQLAKMARGQQPMQPSTVPPQSMGQRPAAAGSEAQIIANAMGGLNGLPTTARGGNVSMKSTPEEMDKPRILQDAFAEASARFEAAQKVGDTANMRRAQSDVEGIRGEYSKLGNRAPSLAPNQSPNTAPQSAPSFGLQLQSLSDKERISAENDAYKTKLVEQAKADVMPTQARQASISSANDALSVIDKALAHPGLGVATGLSGVVDPRNYIPGQVGKDYQSIQKQLEGKAFLSAFDQLKGGGAISEKEGEKAQQAIARMSTSQSEKEYRQGLKDYREVIQTGLSRLNGKESPKQEQKTLQDYGYKSNDDVLRDARNTLMRNPQARGEVEKRLKAMGLSLGGQ